MIELTKEQRREMHRGGDGLLRVTDPDTRLEYVILRADVYERLRRTLEEVDPSLYEFEEIDKS